MSGMERSKVNTKLMLQLLNGEHNTATPEGWVRIQLVNNQRKMLVELIDRDGDALVTWEIRVPADRSDDLTVDYTGTLACSTTIQVELP